MKNTVSYSTKKRAISIAALLCCITALLFTFGSLMPSAKAQTQSALAGPSILILYDNDAPYGWLGSIYSLKLENLLGHFDAKVTRKALADYSSGDLAANDATFYLGSVWRSQPMPGSMTMDMDANTKPFVWMGVNLWCYAWDMATCAWRQDFNQRYGIQVAYYSGENHPKVIYKHNASRCHRPKQSRRSREMSGCEWHRVALHHPERKFLVRRRYADCFDQL